MRNFQASWSVIFAEATNMTSSYRTGPWLVLAAFILGIGVVLAASILSASLRSEIEHNTSTSALPVTSARASTAPSGSVGDLAASINIAAGKPVVARGGGVTYPNGWGNANDAVDYTTTTNAEGGRWGNNTNGGGGTFEVIDLGAVYTLNGVGYRLEWDGAYHNPFTFHVEVSTDNETWSTASKIVHRYFANGPLHSVDIGVAIPPTPARYVKYAAPPDGSWNGWGNVFHLRAYTPAD
jgi:hypothetical protein